MIPTLDVAVACHPSREALADDLVGKLDCPVTVVMDPDPDGDPSAWRTCRQAWWHLAGSAASHALVLQDDTTVCLHFHAAMLRVLRTQPAAAIAPYANNKAVEKAEEKGDRYVRIRGGVWGQAICLPTSWIKPMLLFLDAPEQQEFYSALYRMKLSEFSPVWYDRRVACWLDRCGFTPVATVPSLVQHIAPSDSLLGHSNKTRVARRFIGETNSGLQVNW